MNCLLLKQNIVLQITIVVGKTNTKKDINNAISYLKTALTYFEADGNHLKTNKGLNFYDKVTSAVNKIYSYLSDPDFGIRY